MIARTCKQCNKLFSSISRDICPECVNKEKEEYRIVEDVLRNNPGISLMEICDKTGIDEKVVLKFIKEGKLKGIEINIELNCEACHKPITVGRLCVTCMDKLSAGLKSGSGKDEKAVEAEKKGMLSKRLKE